jgi:hypothetical protein
MDSFTVVHNVSLSDDMNGRILSLQSSNIVHSDGYLAGVLKFAVQSSTAKPSK